MTSWLFQGNPKAFDIEGYLKTVSLALWTVGQRHLAPQMRVGDRVFFWRAAGSDKEKGGVVAAGRIDSVPEERPQDSESVPFTNDSALLATQLRVAVLMDGGADPRPVIKRDWLKGDPVLSDLRILKLASETNYRLSDTHAERLELLWSNTGRDWNEDESLAGLWAYARTKGGEVSRLPGSPVSDVAVMIGRAVTDVYNKVMNFRFLDPTDEREGLSAGGDTDRTVWSRYFDAVKGTLDSHRIALDYERIWFGAPVAEAGATPSLMSATGDPGIEPNPLVRKRIEERAVDVAEQWYRDAGFQVQNVGIVEAFDLLCKRDGDEVRVEVKGTRGAGSVITLTDGGVRNARLAGKYRVDLFVVSRIRVSFADGVVVAAGGIERRIEAWAPEPERLAPTVYRYQLP